MNLHIIPIPALRDNYIWALHNGRACVLVDPGQSAPPLEFLDRHGLDLAGLLLTHHHADHVGGADEILDRHPAPAWGPDDARIPGRAQTVHEHDIVSIPALNLKFSVLTIPGHTRSHIAFHGDGLLFSGDTLFSVGCGRLFEGTPAQMQVSLDKLARLPPETLIYCGHEYTLANCRFALEVEPHNPALRQRMAQAEAQRAAGQPTLPVALHDELATNPFLRTRKSAVIAAARKREPLPDERPETVLGVIRRWKDGF